MDAIPAPVWATLGGLAVAIVAGTVNLLKARGDGRRADRDAARQEHDGIREDAAYWQQRAKSGDAERDHLRADNEALYEGKQALHNQVDRLLHVNDTVMEQSKTVRTEVANVLRVSGADDAAPEA